MKLTFTKLDTYRKCPLRFRLRYREKLPEVSMGGRNLSLVLHHALRTFLFNARRIFDALPDGDAPVGEETT